MAKTKNAAEQKVTMKLFYDGYKYVDDVTIIVNGKTYIIKRGVEVSVPESVKLAFEDGVMQERQAQKYIDTMHNG